MSLKRLATMTVLATAALAAPASAQLDPPAGVVAAYPSPNERFASPRTEIAFRGRAAADAGRITVTGSRSGRRGGKIVGHSDGKGFSWVASGAFRPRERVTVQTSMPVSGAKNGDFGFSIARTPGAVDIAQRFLETTRPGTRHRWRSRPDLTPPVVTVDPKVRGGSPGHVILSPKSKIDVSQAGPMIIDKAGNPVWFQPLPGITAATDVRVQQYQGKPVITYWEGTSRQGIGYGRLVIRDDAYRVIKRFQVPNGYRADLHEFLITPRDTALVISYPAVKADLRSLGGSRDGQVIDSVIQEIDIATGRVVFEWHSLGNVRISDTFSKPTPSPRIPFDYFHANSVSLDDDGDILVSARNTWGIYKIDRVTGRLEWTLGGKRSTFKLPPAGRFAWQHDARRRDDGTITLFDNSAFPPVRKFSRPLALRLDEKAKTASVASAWKHPRGLLAATQGNRQNLPGGGAFVGWGSQRYFTEFDAAGKPVWDARVAVGYETYRAYLSPWVGRPATRPRAAGVRRSPDSVDVYASWNGSTETVAWEFLAGKSPTTLKTITSAKRTGFETRVLVGTRDRYVAVRAKGAGGETLATSPARRVAG